MANCIVGNKSSLYSYAMKAEMETSIAERKYMAPK
jgi:hypothetical protein